MKTVLRITQRIQPACCKTQCFRYDTWVISAGRDRCIAVRALSSTICAEVVFTVDATMGEQSKSTTRGPWPAWRMALVLLAGSGTAHPQVPKADPRSPIVEGQVFLANGAGNADVEVTLLDTAEDGQEIKVAAARTNRYGDFAVHHDNPLEGSFVLVFRKEGFIEARRNVDLVPGEAPPFVDLVLQGGTTVRGTVTAREGGQPVRDARVRVWSAGRERTTTTTKDGTFVIPEVVPGPTEITIDADGYGRLKRSADAVADASPLRFELGPERFCKVVVVDWQGTPIPDALLAGFDDHLHDRWSGRSDEHGVIRLRGIPREASTLYVQLTHPDYVSDEGPTREIELPEDHAEGERFLTLLAAGTVTGKVLEADSREPVQGVRVTVGRSLDSALTRAWTGFDGAFSIAGVPPGPNVVTAYLRGYATDLQTIKVQPGENPGIEFVLRPSPQAGGVVVDDQGNPVAGAVLFATSWRGYEVLGVQAMTDEAGRLVLDTIPNDEFVVAIHGPGSRVLEDQTIIPGKMDHRFQLPPAPAAAQAGTLPRTLRTGDPLPELKMTTLDGKPLTTADLRGKLVLIDFWATWCGPCVADIPLLKEIHTAFGSRRDFLMVNISMDEDRDEAKVRKLIEKNKMSWTHVLGSKAGAKKAADACGVTFLPTKLLVGPDGTLKAANLDGPGVKQTIQDHLPGTATTDTNGTQDR